MKNFKWLSVIVMLTLITSCSRDLPELKGIELARWKADEGGCQGIREQTLDTLTVQKNLLLGLSEMQIVEVLGKPDHSELYKRNQKFYFYFLQPSASCSSSGQSPLFLQIRFNAVGLAKEVSID